LDSEKNYIPMYISFPFYYSNNIPSTNRFLKYKYTKNYIDIHSNECLFRANNVRTGIDIMKWNGWVFLQK